MSKHKSWMEVYLYKNSEMCKLSITVISEPHLTLSRCLFMVDTIVPVLLCISSHNEGKKDIQNHPLHRDMFWPTPDLAQHGNNLCVYLYTVTRDQETHFWVRLGIVSDWLCWTMKCLLISFSFWGFRCDLCSSSSTIVQKTFRRFFKWVLLYGCCLVPSVSLLQAHPQPPLRLVLLKRSIYSSLMSEWCNDERMVTIPIFVWLP